MNKICEHCKKEFEDKSVNKLKKYCNKKCNALSWYHKHQGAKTKIHICEECNEGFEHKFKNVRFCSKKCGLKNSRDKDRERYKKWDREYYKKTRIKQLKIQKKYRDRSQINKKRTTNGHNAFNAIRQRCNNPNNKSYKYYGEKGIKCLLNFEEFQTIYFSTNNCDICNKQLSDINRKFGQDSRSIDRINSNGNYELNNIQIICRSCNTKRTNK